MSDKEFVDPFNTNIRKLENLPIGIASNEVEPGGAKKLKESLAVAARPLEERKQLNSEIQQALGNLWSSTRMNDLFNGDDWAQYAELDSRKIGITHRKPNVRSGEISSQQAMLLVNEGMKTGRITNIPLWHTGIRVTLGTIHQDEMWDLRSRLNELHTEIGAATTGLVWSTDNVIMNCVIADFVIDHISAATVRADKDKSLQQTVRELLLPQDIDLLAAGCLAAVYPQGYPYYHTCVNFTEEQSVCGYNTVRNKDIKLNERPHLDFKRMVWVRNNRFSEANLRHMSAVNDAHDVEMVKAYQTDLFGDSTTSIGPFNESGSLITANVRVPTYMDYRAQGTAWVNSINERVNSVLETSSDMTQKKLQDKRSNLYRTLIGNLSCQRDASWVDHIRFDHPSEGDEAIEPGYLREHIGVVSLLGEFSKDRARASDMLNSILEFKLDNTLAFPGMPRWRCPSCSTVQEDDTSPHAGIIPVSMAGYFFDIMELQGYQENL